MKSSTYKEKAKKLKDELAGIKDCPRNQKRIAEKKAEIKRLNAKAKEKKLEEESKTPKSLNASTAKKRPTVKTNTNSRTPKIIEDNSKELFEKGEELDKKNKKKYENMSLDELKKKLEEVKNFDVGCTQKEFEDVQSKAIVLNRLIKQRETPIEERVANKVAKMNGVSSLLVPKSKEYVEKLINTGIKAEMNLGGCNIEEAKKRVSETLDITEEEIAAYYKD
nr:hypothetical protein [uncultured Treponema sp.]